MPAEPSKEPAHLPSDSDVRSVLDALREKLLDLSTRNRLLSFRHSRSNCIRIVDELPDQLFAELMDGKSFSLVAVPEPTKQEISEYIETLDDPPESEPADPEAVRPTADVWAKRSGISATYELPFPITSGEGPEKHADAGAQTLLYPDDLERRARKLAADARTATEESGVNMFHLALGFLEWTDPKSDEKSFLAPLVLVPVELRRTRQGSRFKYTFAWTGEDLQENLSLRHKLDQLGLVLPGFEDPLVPEDYFAQVARLVADRPAWRIRRMASFALFNFAKLQMFLDLDPERWPAEFALESRPLVKSLLAGERRERGDGSLRFEEMAEADQAEYIDLQLDLVDNADSSQARALISALGGDSLVVQGPPGTGKSQTITNLTAAALAAGKTVLFISEKLAALEVVRRRMKELGLGDFCLELHSNKTRKAMLVEDVARRLAASHRFGTPERLQGIEAQLREERDRLDRFVALSRRPRGALGWPLSRVLFESGKARHVLGDVTINLPDPRSFDLEEITEGDRRRTHEALAGVVEQISKSGGVKGLAENPWRGVRSDRVLGHDVLRAASAARSVARALRDLKDRVVGFGELVGLEESATEAQTADIAGLSDLKTAFDEAVAHATDAVAFADEVERLSGTDLGAGRARIEASVAMVDVVAACPRPDKISLNPAVASEDIDAVLDRVGQRVDRAKELAPEIWAQVDLKAARRQDLNRHVVSRAADVIESAGLLGRLGSDFRHARDVWRSINLPGASRPDPAILRRLAEYLEQLEMLTDDDEATRLLGDAFKGEDTDIEALRNARQWYRDLESASGDADADIAGTLFGLDGEALELLALGAAHPLRDSACAWLALIRDQPALAPGLGDPADFAGVFLSASVAWIPAAARERLATDGDAWRPLIESSARVAATLERVRSARSDFAGVVGEEKVEALAGPGQSLADAAQSTLHAADSIEDLNAWLDFDRVFQGVDDPVAHRLTDMVLNADLAPEHLLTAYDHLLFDRLARAAIEGEPDLRSYLNLSIDDIRERYRELDEATMELRRARIAADLAARPVPEGRQSARVGDLTDSALLRKEIKKKRRHLPIRKLVSRAGNALQALKPCFMMGPASVAQYLVPGEITFDLVIMDEASQLRPEDAVGALARAGQAVIVGDSKQLPPTSFFDTLGDSTGEEEDEDLVASTMESVLDQAEALLPTRTLKWHYRSRHPSLIQFSNKHFYDGDLVVFPAPDVDRPDAGVSFEFVADATCESGVNRLEAHAVAAAAVEHLRRHPTKSLGVVAMNIHQKEQIEAEVDRLLAESRGILEHVRTGNGSSEPFFIKNLENVQGDERDVIFLSMTYGPPGPGLPVPQRFGPINQEFGWRRLNVLFTRAKERMVVFSSMRSEDVSAASDAKRGVRALKAFLHWAEHGHDQAPETDGRPADSVFEIAVIEALEALGHHCTPQVGVAGFFIDIGIEDPDRPGAFILGIECDGAQYHSTLSARDRDRLRQTVLEDLYGWTIERVWSTDWYQDPDRVLARISERIEAERALRKARQADDHATDEKAVVSAVPDILDGEFSPVTEPESTDASAELDGPEPTLQLEAPGKLLDRPDASVRISVDDARQQLVNLREYRIKPENPDADPTRGLLRRMMLEALLRERPVTMDEWLTRIPHSLREVTDPAQLQTYGEEVFAILEMIGE